MQRKLIKLLGCILLIWQAGSVTAQTIGQASTQASIDSISWQQYLAEDWDGLIQTGKLAAKQGIDFKWLQQRLGYAYFVRGKYYESKIHYRKALEMDPIDEVNHLYLYYNSLYTGHLMHARYHAGKLSEQTQQELNIRNFRPLYSIDAEYSYKRPDRDYRDSEIRKDAQYRRIGIQSNLGHRFSLYQTISGYYQDFDIINSTNQLEYVALASFQLFSTTTLQAGYRYTGTRSVLQPDTFYTPGHSLNGSLSYSVGRFDLSASLNWLQNDYITVNQLGLQAGIGFSGTMPVYLNSSVYYLNEDGINLTSWEEYTRSHWVFQQTAGFMPVSKTWVEGAVTFGDQNYYVSHNGVYLFNSQDPVRFKAGVSVTHYFNRNLSFSLHYGLEKKYMEEYDLNYYQNGLTAGITWKL